LTGTQLALERQVPDAKQVERLTLSLLHDNRVTYRLETRPQIPGRADQGGGGVRRRRPVGARMHRQRGPGDNSGQLRGQDVLRLLFRVPRRVQGKRQEVRRGVGEEAQEVIRRARGRSAVGFLRCGWRRTAPRQVGRK
jgi:hypothetical protein